MKPMIILPPDTMGQDDIEQLIQNDICVVIAKDPAKVKFVDPIPAASSRTQIENAAIRLSRKLLNGHWMTVTNSNVLGRGDITRLFVECLVAGTPLDPNGSYEEQERACFNTAKREEIQRLAKEEARAERAAAKKAKEKT